MARTRNVALEKVLEEVIYPLVPQKRLLAVDEIADYAMFLASDLAKGVTGQAAVIDGGYTASIRKECQLELALFFYLFNFEFSLKNLSSDLLLLLLRINNTFPLEELHH